MFSYSPLFLYNFLLLLENSSEGCSCYIEGKQERTAFKSLLKKKKKQKKKKKARETLKRKRKKTGTFIEE